MHAPAHPTLPKKRRRPVVVAGITITAFLTAVLVTVHGWADGHVRYVMGGISAPANCFSCHAYMNQGGFVKSVLEEDYLSPRDLAVSPDGSRVYVVAEEARALLVVSTAERRVVGRVGLGDHPHSIALSADGTHAYVTNTWDDVVLVVDLAALAVVDTFATGAGPVGLALGPGDDALFVANHVSDDVSVIDLATGAETVRLAAGNNPYAVRRSPDGREVYVTSRFTQGTGFRAPPVTEVTRLDASAGRLAGRTLVPSAHILEGLAFAGDLALVTLVRPKNLLPQTQLQRGWMLTYGLGVIDRARPDRVVQLLTDELDAYFADPYDVAVTPDGRRAFVTHAAADVVTAIDLDAVRALVATAAPDSLARWANHLGLSRRYVLARIPTGANPKRMAVSPDGRRLYVAERLDDRIGVVDTETLQTLEPIDLGGPRRVSTLRLGARQFHHARAFQGQFSCRSCHPDEDQDAVSWDFGGDGIGQNIVNTMTLRAIGETSPFKWAGTNTSLYMQDGIRFAKHLTRVDPFPPRELKALVAYIYEQRQPPNRYRRPGTPLTEVQARGKALFERTVTLTGEPIPEANRCITCHPPPFYTNRQKFDVGTKRAFDKMDVLDTPQLMNIYDGAPYLHDGSAASLEEIWTINSVNDEHGVVSDLTKLELNELVEYLRTLGPPHQEDANGESITGN